MKQKFLELVEKVKQTGIVEVMYAASTAEELKKVWRMFSEENTELFTKIKDWAGEFRKAKSGGIFERGEELENPMEIAIVIFIIDDERDVSECEIFEDWDDLAEAMEKIDNNIAKRIAKLVKCEFICKIKAEDIFYKEREAFLELVEKVKKTGIAEAVYKTTTAEELKEVWQKFLEENPDLITRIRDWAEKFEREESREIFMCEEKLENPMEIAIVIFIINDENVTEYEIFARWDDLVEAVTEIDSQIAKRITEFVEHGYICKITAEDIFPEEDAAGEAAE